MLHVTCDMWHVTCDKLWGLTFPQNVSSLLNLTLCDLWYFDDLEEKADSLAESINYKGVCRTAPATPFFFFSGSDETLKVAKNQWFRCCWSIIFGSSEEPTETNVWVQFREIPSFKLLHWKGFYSAICFGSDKKTYHSMFFLALLGVVATIFTRP